jgi:hypothetical protein
MKKYFFLTFVVLYLGIEMCHAQYNIIYDFNSSNTSPNGFLTLDNGIVYGEENSNSGNGSIYSIHTDGSGYKPIFNFNGLNGRYPIGALTPSVTGDTLFGATGVGGPSYNAVTHSYGYGCIFSVKTDGTGYNLLFSFNDTDGYFPNGSLVLLGSKLFGMTNTGGIKNLGCIFSINTDGTGFQNILQFDSTNGANPNASLTPSVTGDSLFGMTNGGGSTNYGCIFSILTNGAGYKDLFDFTLTNSNGARPQENLTLWDNTLYGTTWGNGTYQGCVFSINTDGTGFKDILNFNDTNGAFPSTCLTLRQGVLLGTAEQDTGSSGGGVLFSLNTDGTGFKSLVRFTGKNGGTPTGALTLSVTGDTLFGTAGGGTNGYGIIYSLGPLPTGIDELNSSDETVRLYPNPNNGLFNLELPRVTKLSIQIYNMLGEQIFTNNYPILASRSISIDISNQPMGIYLYRLVSEKGEFIGSGKLVVQK